jgi:PPOX class probable F420-dependent enzyme
MTTAMSVGAVLEPVIPPDHLDLFLRPIVGVLTTLGIDGQPHSCLVWVDTDLEGHARFNTTLDRQSGRNLRRDPRVSLLVVDPLDTSRFVQIRGTVALQRAGAVEHLDDLTHRYTRHPSFYGGVYPVEQAHRETRVIGLIHARRITCDAIHA